MLGGAGASSSEDDEVSVNARLGMSLFFFRFPYLSANVSETADLRLLNLSIRSSFDEEEEEAGACSRDVEGSFVSFVDSSR